MAENAKIVIPERLPQNFVFESEEYGQLRTFTTNEGEILFAGVDVCRALEIKNSRDAISRLDDDEKMTVDLTDSHSGQRGGAQKMVYVTEPGLYHLIFMSRKKEAKDFQRYVYHKVLPSIRKNGYYCEPEKEFVYVPNFVFTIFIPRYFEGELVYTARDLKNLLKVTDFQFCKAKKQLAAKLEEIDGVKKPNFEQWSNFLKVNRIGRRLKMCTLYSLAAAKLFFDYFGVIFPRDLEDIPQFCNSVNKVDVAELLNGFVSANEMMKIQIDLMIEYFVASGCIKKIK